MLNDRWGVLNFECQLEARNRRQDGYLSSPEHSRDGSVNWNMETGTYTRCQISFDVFQMRFNKMLVWNVSSY